MGPGELIIPILAAGPAWLVITGLVVWRKGWILGLIFGFTAGPVISFLLSAALLSLALLLTPLGKGMR